MVNRSEHKQIRSKKYFLVEMVEEIKREYGETVWKDKKDDKGKDSKKDDKEKKKSKEDKKEG